MEMMDASLLSKLPKQCKGLLVATLACLASCGLSEGVVVPIGSPASQTLAKPRVDVTSVQDIPPRSSQNLTLYLEGQVGRQVPLVGGHVYELRDATASIWVVRQGAMLNSGDRVLIQGIVRYQPIQIGNRDMGETYIEEQQQLFRAP